MVHKLLIMNEYFVPKAIKNVEKSWDCRIKLVDKNEKGFIFLRVNGETIHLRLDEFEKSNWIKFEFENDYTI